MNINIEYVSGFFDADGSISISKASKKSKYKSIKIDFYNNEISILKGIMAYLQGVGIKSYISTRQPIKDTHKTSYTLSVQGSYARALCELLKSNHPKKVHRINCISKYWGIVTIRNGKYSKRQRQQKLAFERLFFCRI